VISCGDITRNQLISPDIRRYQEVSGDAAWRQGGLGAGKTSQEETRRVAELAERLATDNRASALPGAELYLVLESREGSR